MAHKRRLQQRDIARDNAVGVMTVEAPGKKRRADPTALTWRQVSTLISRKSVQVAHLQNVLRSRVTDKATTPQVDYALALGAAASLDDQQLIAKYIAESVYEDMRHVGLSANHVIYVASELVSTVSDDLRTCRERSQDLDDIEDK